MAYPTLYPPQANSPETKIVYEISPADTVLYIKDTSILPPPPTYLVIGGDSNTAETVLFKEISNNTITVERGIEGTPQLWPADTTIARNFTAKDHAAMQEWLGTLQERKVDSWRNHRIDPLGPNHPKAEFFTVSDVDAPNWGLPGRWYHVMYLPHRDANGFGMMMVWDLHDAAIMWTRCAIGEEWQNWKRIDSASLGATDPANGHAITSIQGAINSVFTFASNGKAAVAGAIREKGIAASDSDTFETLANHIKSIH